LTCIVQVFVNTGCVSVEQHYHCLQQYTARDTYTVRG